MLTSLFTVVSVLALGATANPIGERSDEYHTVNVSHEYFINEYTTFGSSGLDPFTPSTSAISGA